MLWAAIGQILDNIKQLEEKQEKMKSTAAGGNFGVVDGSVSFSTLSGQMCNTSTQLETDISILEKDQGKPFNHWILISRN
jgi:hypothetical protein